MVDMASKVSVKKFVPRSGVVIHTNDEEAKAAESSGGEREMKWFSGERCDYSSTRLYSLGTLGKGWLYN